MPDSLSKPADEPTEFFRRLRVRILHGDILCVEYFDPESGSRKSVNMFADLENKDLLYARIRLACESIWRELHGGDLWFCANWVKELGYNHRVKTPLLYARPATATH